MKVCLNMIVKDEEHCIEQCLKSVVDHIDYYVICDTGSSDNTIDIIKDFFVKAGIDGVVHQHKWVDFATNRNKALDAVPTEYDYAFVMDADDEFVGSIPELTGDVVELVSSSENGFEYTRRHFIKPGQGFYYKGVVHEYITRDKPYDVEVVPKEQCHVVARSIGSRNSDGKEAKFKADIKLLKKGLKAEPHNTRYQFYLGQSYMALKDYPNAIHWYKRRVDAGGYPEEVAVSMRKIGLAMFLHGDGFEACRAAMIDAWEYRPSRGEPLYDLCRLCRKFEKPAQGMMFAAQLKQLPYPTKDRLFVEKFIWDWAALEELAYAAYNVGRIEAATAMFRELIDVAPDEHKQKALLNFDKCVEEINGNTDG